MGRVTRRYPVLVIDGSQVRRQPDSVSVEEPLEIRLDGQPWQVTMRTPGDDLELVHGLLAAEQVISAADQIVQARYCDGVGPDGANTYNVLDVTLGPGAQPPDPDQHRAVVTTSACGICGSASIEAIQRRARFPLSTTTRYGLDVVRLAPELLRARQRSFDRTGGLHGAGLISGRGEVLVVREDVGRHNAVDKVIGWALRERLLPLPDAFLVVSGRASFELTQKAVLAGIGMLVAVSAPSSLAVELARDTGLTLIGFVRGERMNVYAGAERLELGPDPATIAVDRENDDGEVRRSPERTSR